MKTFIVAPTRRTMATIASILALGSASAVVHAQTPAAGLSSLAPTYRAAVEQLVDSMRAAKLPVDPLYAKVAEGKLKDATDSAIVAAVRALAKRQVEVRTALGPQLDAGALGAAATALKAGVPITTLQQMAKLTTAARDPNAELTVALITVVDLMGQHVPESPAVASVESLVSRGASDDQYSRLRLAVEADVVAGQSPESAVRARTDAIVKSLPTPPRPPIAGGRGGAIDPPR